MSASPFNALGLSPPPDDRPILIAGPTASGKSELALRIAECHGGCVVNADALQVFDGWRILTARPSKADVSRAPHALYGHVPFDAGYSAGDWLRDVVPLLQTGPRPIIVGGTGLYFAALTEGFADIPAIPPDVRADGDARSLNDMRAELDPETADRIDLRNRARVQRAWEVLKATNRPLAAWQDDPARPALAPGQAMRLCLEAPPDWLSPRIATRFAMMMERGALDEALRMRPVWDPALQSSKAIGAAELIAVVDGRMTREAAAEKAIIATRQYAKRQRTWFRKRMVDWDWVQPEA